MLLQKINKNIIFAILFCLILFGCSKPRCLNCTNYNMLEFNGNLDNFIDSLYFCEDDDTWDEIVWGEYSYISSLGGTVQDGGDLSFIDLDVYTLGYRIVDNNDVDNDGIVNQYDNDVDNDGILNFDDTSPYGIHDNSIIELIICTEE